MGEYPVASRKNDFQSPPRPFVLNGGPGQVSTFAVSTTAAVLDLAQGFSMAPLDLQVSGKQPKAPTRNYLSIIADADIGVVFGPTLASVTAANVPAIAIVGTVNGSGVYSGVVKTCWVVKANTPARFLMQAGVDMFLGIVASGAGVARVYQSSPDDA